ncbi:uncharacterized protein SCHCODRAFT_01164297 [Schizophyllum commune H4-8]|nr:uncharacterized protein SCHCODRAFT_01164297 [Schizophyllum commune H4-8]KAI5885250.1 hypothetical protein SCHCODRAFT_01164297 [Schizophyllum commune H4-8]
MSSQNEQKAILKFELLSTLPAAGKISRAPDGEVRPKRKVLQAHSIAGMMGLRSGSRATAAITAHPESRVTIPPSSLLPFSLLSASFLLPLCFLVISARHGL